MCCVNEEGSVCDALSSQPSVGFNKAFIKHRSSFPPTSHDEGKRVQEISNLQLFRLKDPFHFYLVGQLSGRSHKTRAAVSHDKIMQTQEKLHRFKHPVNAA